MIDMKDFRFIKNAQREAQREAQKAKEATAAKARELKEQASVAADDLKTMTTDVKGHIAEQAAGISEIGLAKMNETLADFNAALPALREAGYTLDGVNIDLGVPPRIVANFSSSGAASDETIERLLAENAERNLTAMLVKSINQAAKLQSKINIKGLKPRGLSVEIGLVPRIVVKFSPT